MKVSEVMTPSPNCCLAGVSARLAAGLLASFGVGFLPVVEDYSSRRLVGVITDRDLCLRVLAKRSDPDEVAVADCMTSDPARCSPETDLQQVLELMAYHRVRRLPVVDQENKLLGIVSIDDLIRENAVPAVRICSALERIMRTTPRSHVTGTGA